MSDDINLYSTHVYIDCERCGADIEISVSDDWMFLAPVTGPVLCSNCREIDRLKEELATARGEQKACPGCGRLWMRDKPCPWCRIAELEATLKAIMSYDEQPGSMSGPSEFELRNQIRNMKRIAKAALVATREGM
jgi:hypothetical protein